MTGRRKEREMGRTKVKCSSSLILWQSIERKTTYLTIV